MTKKKTIFISLGLLTGSVLIAMLFFWTAPEAEMEGASKTTAMLVDVVQAEQGDFTPTIVATGIVQPATDISLSNQVGGEITGIAKQFLPGAYVKKGELLLQINPADYKNTLLLRKSDLSLAQSDYEVELGRQDVALKDYELIGDELTSKNQNTPGSDLGRLVGIDEYWVMANIPLSKVNWLSIGEEVGGTGSPVKIVHPAAWEPGQFREGHVSRLVGALDNQTRLARVIIRIADPLLRRKPNPDKPPLIIGTFVEVQIEARELVDVTRLERQYIRPGNTVWVIQEGKLNIRNVNILFEDQDFAYINEGLSANDQVVATDLATVVDGSPLRLDPDK